MFLKKVKAKGHYYLQIAHSYREGGKIKHKILASLGRFDFFKDHPQLIRMGKRFLELAERPPAKPFHIQELDRFVYGHIVYRKLWDKWGFGSLLKGLIKMKKVHFEFLASVFLLTIDRLLSPQSKLKSFENQGRYVDLKKMKLHNMYRCLDLLCEGKDRIENALFERRQDLLNYKVDIVFYDVTTFHFESVVADDLRDFGFSKNARFNEVQVVLGLLVDSYGIPVGFDLFPGNTYEGETIVKAIEKLKARFEIGEVIIVTDKAMSNKQNFRRIRDAKYHYIISMRLRSLPQTLQNKILKEEGYRSLKYDGEGKFRYKIIKDYPQKMLNEKKETSKEKVNLICFWSEKMAKKNRADRERAIEKAKAKLEKGQGNNDKRGYRRYWKTDGKKKIVGMDNERIEQDARYDGYYVIESSNTELSASRVITEYKRLWRIENTFRVMKSSLWTRPIFHWTPRRIKGHFVLCFIALLLERTLEQKLRQKGIMLSPEKIKSALNSLQVSLIEMDGEKYYLKGKIEKSASSILRMMKIKQPPHFVPIEKFQL